MHTMYVNNSKAQKTNSVCEYKELRFPLLAMAKVQYHSYINDD